MLKKLHWILVNQTKKDKFGTKEEKVLERQSRAHRRKHKRYLKDQESLRKARDNGFISISNGRSWITGSYFT
jgi:hypothetical protein